jgi:hypothetical protein
MLGVWSPADAANVVENASTSGMVFMPSKLRGRRYEVLTDRRRFAFKPAHSCDTRAKHRQ